MDFSRAALLATVPLAATACTAAAAANIDPERDSDCYVLSSYFTALAEEMNAPPAARHANAIAKGWFEARVGPADRSPAQVEPLLQLIERDPMSMRDEMAACAIRAANDPGFDAFARARSR